MTIKNEFETVTKSDPVSRYRYFLNVVIDTAEVWVARLPSGVLYSFERDGATIIPVFARRMFIDGWDRKPQEVTVANLALDELIEQELSAGQWRDAVVAVIPTHHDLGHLVDVPRFCRDVKMELDLIT